MYYTKPALSFDEQLDLLRQRGLAIPDADRATRWLQKVSYYRLSAYCLPFKDGETFRAGTDFNDVAGLYIFDRKLRLLMLDAIERIEVAIRTAITYEIAHAFGFQALRCAGAGVEAEDRGRVRGRRAVPAQLAARADLPAQCLRAPQSSLEPEHR